LSSDDYFSFVALVMHLPTDMMVDVFAVPLVSVIMMLIFTES